MITSTNSSEFTLTFAKRGSQLLAEKVCQLLVRLVDLFVGQRLLGGTVDKVICKALPALLDALALIDVEQAEAFEVLGVGFLDQCH